MQKEDTNSKTNPALKFLTIYPTVMAYIACAFIGYDAARGYAFKKHQELGIKKLIARFLSRKDLPVIGAWAAVDALYLTLRSTAKDEHQGAAQSTAALHENDEGSQRPLRQEPEQDNKRSNHSHAERIDVDRANIPQAQR